MKLNWRWRLAQKLELFWWKNYLSQKQPADYLAWKKTYWQTLFQQIGKDVPITERTQILELGCGPAGCFVFLDKNNITAVDPLIEEYERQLEHFRKSDYPKTRFVQSTMEELLLKETADIVLCMNAINHVNDISKAVNVIAQALKPDGIVLMSVDAHNNNWIKKIFRLIPGDALHPHQYELNEYIQMLQHAGLKVERIIQLKKNLIFSYHLIIAKK